MAIGRDCLLLRLAFEKTGFLRHLWFSTILASHWLFRVLPSRVRAAAVLCSFTFEILGLLGRPIGLSGLGIHFRRLGFISKGYLRASPVGEPKKKKFDFPNMTVRDGKNFCFSDIPLKPQKKNNQKNEKKNCPKIFPLIRHLISSPKLIRPIQAISKCIIRSKVMITTLLLTRPMEKLGANYRVGLDLEHLRHQHRRHTAELVEIRHHWRAPVPVLPERITDVSGDR